MLGVLPKKAGEDGERLAEAQEDSAAAVRATPRVRSFTDARCRLENVVKGEKAKEREGSCFTRLFGRGAAKCLGAAEGETWKRSLHTDEARAARRRAEQSRAEQSGRTWSQSQLPAATASLTFMPRPGSAVGPALEHVQPRAPKLLKLGRVCLDKAENVASDRTPDDFALYSITTEGHDPRHPRHRRHCFRPNRQRAAGTHSASGR